MRLTGFRQFDWEPLGYYWSLNPNLPLVNPVEPNVLYRPGATPTFGISTIGAMTIVGKVGTNAGSWAALQGAEEAFVYFFKRLNPLDTSLGELRGVRNNGLAVKIPAMLQIPAYSSEDDVIIRDLNFVCATAIWTSIGYSTAAGGFS